MRVGEETEQVDALGLPTGPRPERPKPAQQPQPGQPAQPAYGEPGYMTGYSSAQAATGVYNAPPSYDSPPRPEGGGSSYAGYDTYPGGPESGGRPDPLSAPVAADRYGSADSGRRRPGYDPLQVSPEGGYPSGQSGSSYGQPGAQGGQGGQGAQQGKYGDAYGPQAPGQQASSPQPSSSPPSSPQGQRGQYGDGYPQPGQAGQYGDAPAYGSQGQPAPGSPAQQGAPQNSPQSPQPGAQQAALPSAQQAGQYGEATAYRGADTGYRRPERPDQGYGSDSPYGTESPYGTDSPYGPDSPTYAGEPAYGGAPAGAGTSGSSASSGATGASAASPAGTAYAEPAPYRAEPAPPRAEPQQQYAAVEPPPGQGETAALAAQFAQRFSMLADNIERIIRGKREAVELALVCMFSEGHLLVEDVPGTGKTTLARAVAASVDAQWRRIQFTPDLLPSDITGVSIFNQATQKFEFHQGPVFANIVLGDEINRASPKTQSALLEVMEERRVTVDSEPHAVPRPFLVVATQNPVDMDGTYPLPEAQLDRFLMRISVGYPDRTAEIEVLKGMPTGPQVERLPVVARASDVAGMIDFATRIHVADPIYDYVVAVVSATRTAEGVRLGASPRASLALLRAARVRAAAAGRHYVVPEDVKTLAVPVLAHRLVLTPEAELREQTAEALLGEILRGVPVPPSLAGV